MKSLTLLEAGKAVGRSKQAIAKAVKNGTISAQKDSKGIYKIDPSELFRVYEPIQNGNDQVSPTEPPKDTTLETTNHQTKSADKTIEKDVLIAKLQAELKATQEKLIDKNEQLGKAEERAKEADKERKEAQEKLTLLLTDQSVSKRKKGLLGSIFG